MKRRPYAWVVVNVENKYSEMWPTKAAAREHALDLLWFYKGVEIRPLYLGRAVKWIGRKERAARSWKR